MARCLFTVEDTFEITGRGLVLVPGIVPEGNELFSVGDPILLKYPDRRIVNTVIGALEILSPNPWHDVVIMLTSLKKPDVPVGTEVWSIDRA